MSALVWEIDPAHQFAWIDVRSEKEFALAHVPGFINIPILNDQQRHLVGICYKQNGKEAAISLGIELTRQDRGEKLSRWAEAISLAPSKKAFVTCFRGGLRSRFAVEWLTEAGFLVSQIPGGYKASRQKILEILENPKQSFIVVSGKTGSHKTKLIESFSHCSLNLENDAHHRGSAFGGMGQQPAQAVFENIVARTLFFNKNPTLLLEDESRHIGKLYLPEKIFTLIRTCPIVLIEESLEIRVQNIFNDYVLNATGERFVKSTESIRKKLGNQRTDQILKEITTAFSISEQNGISSLKEHYYWISDLLTCYYDPCYLYGFKKAEQDRKVLFQGTYKETSQWLLNLLKQ